MKDTPKLQLPDWAAYLVALLGLGVYTVQSWFYAHSTASVLDEGAYLYKGYLFVTGQYIPFQDYGAWTNHMPLSFLIPGYIQKWFGLGLGTARAFMLALGILTLIGIWIIVRRFSGHWWAALAIWMVALNPFTISLYSIAASQGLIVCMLIWVMVFSLGEEQPIEQLFLGSILAAALWLTRINMAPVLPVLILYIFWQYDRKTGIRVALAGAFILIIGHALYFPDILKLWVQWLPRDLTPFLDPWRIPAADAVRSWNPPVETLDRIFSFWRSVRSHAVAFLGWFTVAMLWAHPKHWKKSAHYKTAVFLFSLFGILFLLHAWASLGHSYCVDCFKNYLGFFSPLGILLICISFPNTKKQNSRWTSWIFSLVMLGVSTAVAFSYTINAELKNKILKIPVPRIQSLQFLPGTTPFGAALENKFAFSDKLLKHLLVAPAGFVVGAILLLISLYVYKKTKKNFVTIVASAFFVASMLLSFSPILGQFKSTENCGDVIAANENAGSHIANIIPAGSKVYWAGGLSVAPMLYVPDISFPIPQINGGYSFHLGGNSDTLLKFGRWNEDLSQQWKEEADFLLIDERHYSEEWSGFLGSKNFDEMPPTAPTIPCRDDSSIHIFRRLR